VKIAPGKVYEDVVVVDGEMLKHCDQVPKKASKGEFDGENYVVRLAN